MKITSVRLVVAALLFASVFACEIHGAGRNVLKKVFVPISQSTNCERSVQIQLTERIIREIEMRTDMIVVGRPDEADVILTTTVNAFSKGIIEGKRPVAPLNPGTALEVSVIVTHNPPLAADLERGASDVVGEIGVGEDGRDAVVPRSLASDVVDLLERAR